MPLSTFKQALRWLTDVGLKVVARPGNKPKLDRKEDIDVLYKICVSRVNRNNKMYASGRSENQDGCSDLWLAQIFSTSLKPLNGICQNLTRPNEFFFRTDRKTRWLPLPQICWDPLHYSFGFAWWNLMNLTRSKHSKSSTNFLFLLDRKTKKAAMANLSRKWHIVLTCTICCPFVLLLL